MSYFASAGRNPSRWFWAAPYAAVAFFALSMLVLVAVMQQREIDSERAALARDAQWVEQTLRSRMQVTEEFLANLARDIGAGAADHDAFQLRANQHIADSAELANIAWVAAGEAVRWTAPFDTTDWLPGEPLNPVQAEAARRAVLTGRRSYTPAYRNAHGAPMFDVYFPVSRASGADGALAGAYSVTRLVRDALPAWFLEKYRLSLSGDGGKVLAVSSAVGEVDERLGMVFALEPPGSGLSLQVSALREHGRFAQALPKLLILGLSVLVLWTLWTLRAQLRQRLQAEKERDRLFNLSLDMLFIADVEGRFRRCNPAFERVLGHAPDSLRGRLLIEFVHPDEVGDTLEQLRRLAAGQPAKFENRCRCADGQYRWLMWSINPVPEEKMLYAVAHDITGRKTTE